MIVIFRQTNIKAQASKQVNKPVARPHAVSGGTKKVDYITHAV